MVLGESGSKAFFKITLPIFGFFLIYPVAPTGLKKCKHALRGRARHEKITIDLAGENQPTREKSKKQTKC